jgi:hypothetical protein
VLGDADGDIVADKIAYRAGRNGSVFALGDKLIRLLVFEFDAGPDRVRSGKCIYGKVQPKGAASAETAAPAAKPLSAASTGHPEGKAGAVRITLGIDPAASAVIETYRVR